MQSDAPQVKKPDNNLPQRIWEALSRRPYTKLAALMLAVVFWAVVIASDSSLMVEKTISNATVTVQGADALRNRGYIVMNDLASEPILVKMRTEVKYADYESVTADSFSPRLDLSQIPGEGTHQVRFSAPAYSTAGKVLSFEPESIELTVDLYKRPTRVPVSVEYEGETSEPLWFSDPIPDPTHVYVSGPKSIVDEVKRAVVSIPLHTLSTSRPNDSITVPIYLQDRNGNVISSPLLTVTNESVDIESITLQLRIYPLRLIPVSYETAYTGVPAHGYVLGEARISPEMVLVAGTKETLASLDALHLSSPLDITGQSTAQFTSSGLRGVSDLVYVSTNSIVLDVDIVPATHVHTYNDLPITVMGAAAGLSATLEHSAMSAVVSGQYQHVEPLKAESIHLYVDAASLEEGDHTVDVLCRIDGSDPFSVEFEFPQLILTLKKSEGD